MPRCPALCPRCNPINSRLRPYCGQPRYGQNRRRLVLHIRPALKFCFLPRHGPTFAHNPFFQPSPRRHPPHKKKRRVSPQRGDSAARRAYRHKGAIARAPPPKKTPYDTPPQDSSHPRDARTVSRSPSSVRGPGQPTTATICG